LPAGHATRVAVNVSPELITDPSVNSSTTTGLPKSPVFALGAPTGHVGVYPAHA
jgi:hypothetical protein